MHIKMNQYIKEINNTNSYIATPWAESKGTPTAGTSHYRRQLDCRQQFFAGRPACPEYPCREKSFPAGKYSPAVLLPCFSYHSRQASFASGRPPTCLDNLCRQWDCRGGMTYAGSWIAVEGYNQLNHPSSTYITMLYLISNFNMQSNLHR